MDAQLKAKWVEALRSGEFKQAQSELHDTRNDSYCCLGVLCKVVGAEWTSFDVEVEGEDGIYIATRDHVPVKDGEMLGDTEAEELTPLACGKFGIVDQNILIGLNDGKGKEGEPGYQRPMTFPEIADYIEKYL
jgi:hypothetical protein